MERKGHEEEAERKRERRPSGKLVGEKKRNYEIAIKRLA